MRRDLEAIALAAREEWIVSTRGADLPKSDERLRPRQHSTAERHAAQMARQAKRRAAMRAATTDVKAARAWELREKGWFVGAIARELDTTNAQAGRYIQRGKQLALGERLEASRQAAKRAAAARPATNDTRSGSEAGPASETKRGGQ